MFGIGKAAGLLLVCSAVASAQDAARPSFAVVSVKQAAIPAGLHAVNPVCTDGNYRAPVPGVAASIRYAYNLQTYQLKGMPAWALKADGAFEIEGKSSGPVSEAECRLMVQSLLAERFHLAIHRTTETISLVTLTIARNGARIRPETGAPGPPVMINGTSVDDADKGWTMPQFIDFAAQFFPGGPIADRTGLEGSYRIKLDFGGRHPAAASDAFAAAVESQLGLKFEKRNEPVEMVVVDRLDRPSSK
jgi:uncharacterized protein (TIGR03435 family)